MTPDPAAAAPARAPDEEPLAARLRRAFSLRRNLRFLLVPAADHLRPLDGLRALSVLWVIVFHAGWYIGKAVPVETYTALVFSPWMLPVWRGDFGVDVFFVLSGFLITGLLIEERARTGRLRLGLFYLRRLVRLWPALAVAVLADVLIFGDHVDMVWANLLYVSNFVPILEAAMGWTWSLAIEEQFYLVCPWLVGALAPLGGRSRIAVIAGIALALAAVAAGVVVTASLHAVDSEIVVSREWAVWAYGYDYLYAKPWMRAGPLLMGVGAAYVFRIPGVMEALGRRRALSALGLLAALGVAGASMHWPIVLGAPRGLEVAYLALFRTTFGAAVAYVLLLSLSSSPAGRALAWALSSRLLHPISQVAYSAYLLNPIATVLVEGALAPLVARRGIPPLAVFLPSAALATLLAAAALYLFVERPLMELRPRGARRAQAAGRRAGSDLTEGRPERRREPAGPPRTGGPARVSQGPCSTREPDFSDFLRPGRPPRRGDASAAPPAAAERRLTLHLPGLSCRACARRAERVLAAVPGVVTASVGLVRERADVRFDARRTSWRELCAAMERAGFGVAGIPGEPQGALATLDRGPGGRALLLALGVGLAALANVLLLGRVTGAGEGAAAVAQMALAAVAVAVAGAIPGRRAIRLLRQGLLGREALAGVAAVACFAGAVFELLVNRTSIVPPPWLSELGASAAAWDGGHGAGFAAAVAIAVGALAARGAEEALHRHALREVTARERARSGAEPPRRRGRRGARRRRRRARRRRPHPPGRGRRGAGEPPARRARARRARGRVRAPRVARLPRGRDRARGRGASLGRGHRPRRRGGEHDLAATLDAGVRAALGRLAVTRVEPLAGTWEDAAARGVITAALGCAAFAVVTHGWLGPGPLGPLPVLAAAAVLAGASPAAILVAAPAARAVALLRARAEGVAVADPAALEILGRVDTVCFERASALAHSAGAVHALRLRGIRALVVAPPAAAAIRDLQIAGARVLLVADGRADPAGMAQADVSAALAAGTLPAAPPAPIIVSDGDAGALAGLVDLGRALSTALVENAALGAAYNAVLVPAAALGYLTPLRAAVLVLVETLLGLANAARLLRRPAR